MINLSLREPFESEGHGALKVFYCNKFDLNLATSSFWIWSYLLFCRRASLWSELYSEHPDNKKGITSDGKYKKMKKDMMSL